MYATAHAFVNGPVKVRQLKRKATAKPSWRKAQQAPSPCVVTKPQQVQALLLQQAQLLNH